MKVIQNQKSKFFIINLEVVNSIAMKAAAAQMMLKVRNTIKKILRDQKQL
jgi:hypothetical protein